MKNFEIFNLNHRLRKYVTSRNPQNELGSSEQQR